MQSLEAAYRQIHVIEEQPVQEVSLVEESFELKQGIKKLRVFEVKGLGDCYRVSDGHALLQPKQVPYKQHPQDTESGVDTIDI